MAINSPLRASQLGLKPVFVQVWQQPKFLPVKREFWEISGIVALTTG